MQITTTSMGALYAARLITGLANGLIMNFTFVYIAEMAPAHLRGVAYALATGWVTLGAAIGYVRKPSRASMLISVIPNLRKDAAFR